MIRLLLILLATAPVVVLAACAVVRTYEAEIITGDQNQVSVQGGKRANPGPLAEEHCGQFGKKAVLTNYIPKVDVSVAGEGIYVFECSSQ